MRLIHAANAVLLLGVIGLSLYVYPDLPERIPLHFGPDGSPDRWGDRSLVSWMLLPLTGAATAILLYVVGWLMPGRPHLLNMPDKKKLLELPPPLQNRVLEAASAMMYVTSLALMLMFTAMQYGAWQSTRSGAAGGAMVAGLIFGLVVLPFVMIGFLVVIRRRLDAAWREYRTRAAAMEN